MNTNQGLSISGAKEVSMLRSIAVLLLLMWALGMVSSYTIGGLIHFLLLLALISVCIDLISGRRAV
jgi:hypothetical protein